MAFGNVKETSDIDLLIVTRHNRIWLGRFFATGLMQLFGMRRRGPLVAGRICLSFFVTEDALNFRNLSLEPEDIYLPYWISTLEPLVGDNVYRNLMNQNRWIEEILPNFNFLPHRHQIG